MSKWVTFLYQGEERCSLDNTQLIHIYPHGYHFKTIVFLKHCFSIIQLLKSGSMQYQKMQAKLAGSCTNTHV